MHPLYCARPMPHMPVRITRVALVVYLYTYAPRCFRTSQYCLTFIPLSMSLWNVIADLVFDDAELVGFKSRANAFLLA